MTSVNPLDRHSTPHEIYSVCTTYQQLCQHRQLRPVANLLQCITSFNNRHGIHNTTLAFDRHRDLTLSGQIHRRARLFVRNDAPASASDDDDDDDASTTAAEVQRLVYEQQLTSSMHACLHRHQGQAGAHAEAVAVAVWHRHRASSIFTLDSMSKDASSAHVEHLQHFSALCQALGNLGVAPVVEAVEVAQQSDGISCGLYAIEFCKVVGARGADVSDNTTRALLATVDTTETRAWLNTVANTLDVPMRDPQFVRSSASKRNRTAWESEAAEQAVVIE